MISLTESEEMMNREPVMADPETVNRVRNPLTPQVARRCRIPKLNRSASVRINGETHVDYFKSDRPISLTLPSSKSGKDYPWRYHSNGNGHHHQGSVSSVTFNNGVDDDRSSLKSFGSYVSYTSLASQSQNTEASASRPGSRVRNRKYVLHCESRHLGPTEEYLTPTQRKDKEIRQLKSALLRKTRLLEEKDAEIDRLKSEIERLHDALSEIGNEKHSSMNSSQGSDQLENLNVKNSVSEISFHSNGTEKSDPQITATMNNDDSGISNDMSISPQNISELDESESPVQKVAMSDKECSTDAALLDALIGSVSAATTVKEEESVPAEKKAEEAAVEQVSSSSRVVATGTAAARGREVVENRDVAVQEPPSSPRMPPEMEIFLTSYQKELEQLKTQHKEHYHELKSKFDDRVQDLQQKLCEANSRYFELRPLFDRAQDKILNLENQLGDVQRDMESQEEWHNQMYLKMKGQETSRFDQADEGTTDFAQRNSKRVSVPDLLRQLHQLEAELDETKQLYREALRGMGDRQAEYTLRFLKDAVFYFLTKKDKEHLKAIQSILGFTDAERMAVAKAMKHRRLFCSVFRIKN